MKTSLPHREPTWPDAHRLAFEVAAPVPAQSWPIDRCVGRVAAQPVVAACNLPISTTSAMDGWVVANETGPWRVVASALAGHPLDGALQSGTAAVIATGGVVPEGAFGVLRREFGETYRDDAGAEWVKANLEMGEPREQGHVRPAGTEARQGDVLVEAGTRLTPPQVGVIAMAGIDTVDVRREITGEILIVGDEVETSGIPAPGRVRDAFAPQLPQLARELGLVAPPARFIPDTVDAAANAIAETTADVVITTGGTAAGPADFLHRALEMQGAELIIDLIAMRPGHPNLLARLADGRFLVGLPGNPLSAMIGMLTLTRPLVRGLTGQRPVELGWVETYQAVSAPAREHRLVPYRREDDGAVAPMEWIGSGMLRGLAGADGVMIVPPGGCDAGDWVADFPLPW